MRKKGIERIYPLFRFKGYKSEVLIFEPVTFSHKFVQIVRFSEVLKSCCSDVEGSSVHFLGRYNRCYILNYAKQYYAKQYNG